MTSTFTLRRSNILGRTLTIHSYKGGTGKTSIAANLAASYAKSGSDVCILDYDFRAPSMQVLFKGKPKNYLTDFLDEKCDISDVLIDVTKKNKTKGKLLVGLADHSTKTMREIMTKDRKWEMKALHLTLSAKAALYKDLNVDYIIFDTSPGMHYSSINALAASDFALLVTKMDEFDFEGTKELINGIYDVLGRKTGILLNKIPTMHVPIGDGQKKLEEKLGRSFNLPIFGMIPCYCDVQADGGKTIYTLQQPDHPFSQSIEQLTEKLEDYLGKLDSSE